MFQSCWPVPWLILQPQFDFSRRSWKNESAHWNDADVAELADALDSGSSSRKGVEVQVLSSAPIQSAIYTEMSQVSSRVSLVTATVLLTVSW